MAMLFLVVDTTIMNESISAALEQNAEQASNDRARALSLQVAMLVPVLACLLGLANAFRMVRLPDIEPSVSTEGIDVG
jgi:hypothetical protein